MQTANGLRLTLPAHAARSRGELAQRLHRAHRAKLGEEADHGVDREHDDDGRRLLPLAEDGGERGRGGQQSHHGAPELIDQNADRAARRVREESVEAEAPEPRGGFGFREPVLLADRFPLQNRLGGEGVSGRLGALCDLLQGHKTASWCTAQRPGATRRRLAATRLEPRLRST